MKIKALSIKPGMVINKGNEERTDFELVIATEGLIEVEYTYSDLHDPYWGAYNWYN